MGYVLFFYVRDVVVDVVFPSNTHVGIHSLGEKNEIYHQALWDYFLHLVNGISSP
jgi:hypothetical protein